MRISVSILTSNAFSIRSAIIPDRSDRPFRNVESAGRDTPSTFAAAATARPCGSITSVFTNAPGCGGFSMRILVPRSSGSPRVSGPRSRCRRWRTSAASSALRGGSRSPCDPRPGNVLARSPAPAVRSGAPCIVLRNALGVDCRPIPEQGSRTVFLTALIVSACLFAVPHLLGRSLPTDSALALYASGVVVKSGAAGLVLGWIFWRWGLPYAMVRRVIDVNYTIHLVKSTLHQISTSIHSPRPISSIAARIASA